MNRLVRLNPIRRSSSLIKTQSELSATIAQTKWNLIYTAGQENDKLAKTRFTFRYGMSLVYKVIPLMVAFRTFIYMGTGYETLLLDISDGFNFVLPNQIILAELYEFIDFW